MLQISIWKFGISNRQKCKIIQPKISNPTKVGCVSLMVVISLLSHLKFGQKDHRVSAPHFINSYMSSVKTLHTKAQPWSFEKLGWFYKNHQAGEHCNSNIPKKTKMLKIRYENWCWTEMNLVRFPLVENVGIYIT